MAGYAVRSSFLHSNLSFVPSLAPVWSYTSCFDTLSWQKPGVATEQENWFMPTEPGKFQSQSKGEGETLQVGPQGTTGAVCYLMTAGQAQRSLKPRASPEGDSSGGLPGQKGEMGSCKGGSQHGGCSGGQEPSSPCSDRGHLGAIGTYTGWLLSPHFFPFTVTWTSCSPPAGSEMMTVKKYLWL